MTFEEAYRLLHWQDEFAEYAQQARTHYPDDFTGAEIVPGTTESHVYFKDDVPLLEGAVDGTHTELIGSVGFSEQELVAQVAEVGEALADEGHEQVHVAYDPASGIIDALVDAGTAAAASTDALAGEGVIDAPNVRITVSPDISSSEDALYGGGYLTSCTAGFAVISGRGTRGFLTAGHCPNTQSQRNSPNDAWTATTYQAGHEGEWGDMQWHTTGQYESDDFYADHNPDDRRDLQGWQLPSKGQTLCRWGIETGRECDTVYRVNVTKNEHQRLTLMVNREADSGDSGGPWYFSRTGYGIHEGALFFDLRTRDTFTPLVYVDEGLGLTIATE